MARKVVSRNNAPAKNEQLLKSLAPKPMSKKGIFKIEKLSNELNAVERSYFLCSDVIRGNELSISVDDICKFFKYQFNYVYEHECIDYNLFNCRRTFSNVQNYLSLSEIELLHLVAESFIGFNELKTELNLTDIEPSVSMFKRNFIVDRLSSGGKRFDGFY